MSWDPKEIDEQMNAAWGRLMGSPPESEISGGSAGRGQPLQLAMQMVRRRHDREIAEMQELLESSEQVILDLRLRLKSAEEAAEVMRASFAQAQEEILNNEMEYKARIEEAQKALALQNESHLQESAGAHFKFEQIKKQLAKEQEKLQEEMQRHKSLQESWSRREEKLQRQTAELRDGLEKLEVESEKKREELRREITQKSSQIDQLRRKLEGAQQSAQETVHKLEQALQKTVEELLSERREKASMDERREDGLRKVKELEDHLAVTKATWEEERRQWRELWDRERSSWELQRREFLLWEEKLRKEREAWHKDLRIQEAKELGFAAQMSQVLKDSAEWLAKMTLLLKHFALKGGVAAPPILTAEPVPLRVSYAGAIKRTLWAACIAGLLGGVSAHVYRNYFHRIFLKSESAAEVDVPNAKAITFDGALLWIADYGGRLYALSPDRPKEFVHVVGLANRSSYRPVALSFGGDSLWSLDFGQGQALRHRPKDPSSAILSLSEAGNLATAIAFDGVYLWSYQPFENRLLRSVPNPQDPSFRTFSLGAGRIVTCMQWVGSDLWAYDSASAELIHYRFKEDSFKLLSSRKMDPEILAFTIVGKHLWALAPASREGGKPLLKKFKIIIP
ncbi:MAG: hypothetical protein HY611_08850 [Elusimicrobia bacterium]|nr:hypothetical protein [Elusimicrobiota bacterium]